MEGLEEGNCKAKGKQRHRSDAGFSRRTKAVGPGGQAAMGIASRGLPAAVCATYIWWSRAPSPTHIPRKASATETPAPSSLGAGYMASGLAHCSD